jgi:hypothetical protein
MWKMKPTAFTYLLLILISCQTPTDKEQTKNKTETLVVNEVQPLAELDEPIDVFEIKNLDWLTTTSGVASNTKNLKFCDWKEEGFFGFYFLIDQEKKGGPVGRLTVHAKDKNGWQFDNRTDEFARIELQTNRIKVWDEIGVGSTKSQLLDFLKPYDITTSDSIVKSRLDNYSAEFTIVSDTVNRLIIERNCKEKNTGANKK